MHYEIKCEVVIDDNAISFSILISPLFDFLRAESEEINCYACVSGGAVELLAKQQEDCKHKAYSLYACVRIYVNVRL